MIDANSADQGMVIQMTGSTVTNAGLIEASAGGWLVIQQTTIANARGGSVQSIGAGTDLDLDGATISGGSVEIGAGSIIDTVNGDASTITGAAVNNAGTLSASYGNLTIDGPVTERWHARRR